MAAVISGEDLAYLRQVGRTLNAAERVSASRAIADVPEGIRWVTLSDTLATAIAARLHDIADRSLFYVDPGEEAADHG